VSPRAAARETSPLTARVRACLPRDTIGRSDFADRFMPPDCHDPLKTTLVQFNAWLLRAYHRAMPAG